VFPFKYCRVSQDLINELHEQIINNQSVVLLGPRYGAKRYVIDRLRALLKKSRISPIVHLRLLAETPICTSVRVAQLVREAVGEAGEGKVGSGDSLGENPFDALRELACHTRKPVILFAANIDGMSHQLARRFLQEVRILVEDKRLIAIMSGESDFRELVHGQNSEFSCANQYVLQGYAFKEFCRFLNQQLKFLRIDFDDLKKASKHLWEITGGNVYILRITLWSVIQQRARMKVSPESAVDIDEIPGALKLVGIPGAYGAHIFRHATQLIARDAPSWRQLEEIMNQRRVPVLPHDAPGRLELAGIATREIQADDAELRFSSPMMKAFIERFYDVRRFGDLYASVGDWDEAFKRYSQLAVEERVRPLSTDDRAEVEATIGTLGFSLYAEIASQEGEEKGILQVEALKKLFAQGCHYILGFREITFWYRDTSQQSSEWRLHLLDGFPPGRSVLDNIKQLLPSSSERNLRPGIIESSNPLTKYAVAAVLPSRFNKQLIVVVSDFTGGDVVSHERKEFLAQVLKHLIGAYKPAVDVGNLQLRHRIQRQQAAIIDSIREQDFDLTDLLRKAAQGLRRLDYSRVMFSMVNKERDAIVGVIDDSDNPDLDVAKLTNWPLKNPTADLQPYVVRTRQTKIVRDARNEPLAHKAVVRAADMRAEAIIPILNPVGEAIGTIHVERADRAVPSREEVDDLMFFGRQLAIAIAQGQRMNLHDDAFVQQSLEVSHLPAEATSTDATIAKMLEAMAILGHKWGRLYVVGKTKKGDQVFVSKRWHGVSTRPGSEADFNDGLVVLAPRITGDRDWLCIEKRMPILFCWRDDLGDGQEYTTPNGLKILNWVNPDQPEQIKKSPGDFWMDFPLMHLNDVLGKMCLHLQENLARKHFELLKILSSNFSAILFANLQRDQASDMIKKTVADQTMATMAHNLGTRLGSLPVILDEYRAFGRKYEDLKPLNDTFGTIVAYAQASVKRHNLVSPVTADTKSLNLRAEIVQSLQLNLSKKCWEFRCDEPKVFVKLDPRLFETALLELIQNSRDVARSPSAMRISISLETVLAKTEESATIIYRDNGPGVPDEYREKVFSDFFSYRPTQRVPGFGLGLGFVRRVIEAHGGQILYTGQIDPSDPPGAEFTITLPKTERKEIEDVQNSDS